MSDLPLSFRPMKKEDYGYVIASWSREFYKTDPIKLMDHQDYVPWQTSRINWCIGCTPILIAHLQDEPDSIVGFICATNLNEDDLLVHWINVKGIFRRFGVAKELLKQFQYKNLLFSHYFHLFHKIKDRHTELNYKPLMVIS